MPLSCAWGGVVPGRTAGRTSTGGSTGTTPSARWSLCSAAGGRKRSTPCGSCRCGAGGNPETGLWKTQPHLPEILWKRFQTPTSRNPVMVRRRAENRTWRVRKSILLKYGNLTVYRNTEIKTIYLHSFHSNLIREYSSAGKPAGKEWNGERSSMAQHAILRFEKHKGHPAGPLEAHHERKKEQYASNPDIDTSRSKYNFHIVKPDGRYYHFIQSRIEQARCRTRKDSTRFVDTLITASPDFQGQVPKGDSGLLPEGGGLPH